MPIKTSGQKMPPKLRLRLANECLNPLTRAKIKPSTKEYKFSILHSSQISSELFERLMTLFKSLMQAYYEKSSWGWNEEEKLSEWRHTRTRIIVVTKNDPSDPVNDITYGYIPEDEEEIIGFMCVRFEHGGDKSETALYVYELHIAPEHQRQGLGKELMRMAKILATEFKMDKIMLTAFRSNSQALDFYNKLKFSPDKSSPATNEADYVILHSKLKY